MILNILGALREHVGDEKKAHVRASRKIIKGYNKILMALSRGFKVSPTFRVYVDSYWKDAGEKNIRIEAQGDLEDILTQADNRFNHLNGRVDNQRTYRVYLIQGNLEVEVPTKLYKRYLARLGEQRQNK